MPNTKLLRDWINHNLILPITHFLGGVELFRLTHRGSELDEHFKKDVEEIQRVIYAFAEILLERQKFRENEYLVMQLKLDRVQMILDNMATKATCGDEMDELEQEIQKIQLRLLKLKIHNDTPGFDD